ncbi:MAG: glycosyltransferase family 2 protein [Deltaproteobacteria bacterium]|jgi:glycosyltransferase involved in cell wall biosynthesis|nr:glycosyltransferase family 2 protein [Deltaproteobacteria bacterium]
MKLSVSMTAFNCESIIRRTLEPLLGLADEIIIVDSLSTDRTPEIAREMGATVYQEAWAGYVAQKQSALDKTRGDWILCLDSDEVLDEEAAAAIRKILAADGPADGYYLNRRTFYMNRLLKHAWQPDWKLRLVRRAARPFVYGSDPHDAIGVEGETARLPGGLVHYSYRDFADHMQRSRSHAEVMARSYHKRGKPAGRLDLLFRPPFVLFKRLILQGAVLDGVPGVLAAVSSAAYAYMKYAFLWEMNTKGGTEPAKTGQEKPNKG